MTHYRVSVPLHDEDHPRRRCYVRHWHQPLGNAPQFGWTSQPKEAALFAEIVSAARFALTLGDYLTDYSPEAAADARGIRIHPATGGHTKSFRYRTPTERKAAGEAEQGQLRLV